MFRISQFFRHVAMAIILCATTAAFAEDTATPKGSWIVGKASGDVWLVTEGAQQASLTPDGQLKPGDFIRTGHNGRVLLRRGEETILIAPNSSVGIPTEKTDSLPTTIVQQAGSILLEVEKRNVKHFEVETPYLAAVVKGTQFRVTVSASGSRVDVLRGQVEVADFRSGQIAQVLPGQVATTLAAGKPGLSLSGSGSFSPIEQGKPRSSTIDRIPVPKGGLTAPRNASLGQHIVSLAGFNHAGGASAQTAGGPSAPHGGIRISSALGDVRLDFHKVTHGLARGGTATSGSDRHAARGGTVWASQDSGTSLTSSSQSNNGNSSGVTAVTAATSSSTPVAASVATATATATAIGVGASANNTNNSGNGNNDDDGHGRRYAWGHNRH